MMIVMRNISRLMEAIQTLSAQEAWYIASAFLVVSLLSSYGGILFLRLHRHHLFEKQDACPSQEAAAEKNHSVASFLSRKRRGNVRRDHTKEAVIHRKQDFLQRVGDDYGYRCSAMGFIDTWRPRELPSLVRPVDPVVIRVDADSHKRTSRETSFDEKEVYLDHAGAALPWQSQLREQYNSSGSAEMILANPHSTGPAASRTARRIEQVKKRVLDWLDAHPGRFAGIQSMTREEHTGVNDAAADNNNCHKDTHPGYEILFTSGTTESMKIIGERMAWQPQCAHCHKNNKNDNASKFVYPAEAHTSLVGIRGLALSKGASFHCVPMDQLIQELNAQETPAWNNSQSQSSCPHCSDQVVPSLLGLPLECNFGGNRIPFSQSWLKKLSRPGRPFWSLLDIAKAASTGPVSLRDLNPDFACLSFYKVFGSPTGLGCLLVKRSIVNEWLGCPSPTENAHYHGGGSVDLLLPKQNVIIPRSSPSLLSSLQSGTCHFRGIVELGHGFDVLQRLGGMQAIHSHAVSLASELVTRLQELRHSDQSRVVKIYGAWGRKDAAHVADIGPTVAFNIRRQDGTFVGFNEVAKLAALNRPCPIQLRVGCFCNPGACQSALELDEHRILENYRKTGHVCGDDIDIIDGWPTGAVRASFGKDSIWEDVDALMVFISRVFVGSESKLTTSWYVPSQVIVEEQYIFPIKSCAAQRVPNWQMIPATSRLFFDREFALVDASGTAMRLQRYPKMALIEPSISLESNKMTIKAPGMPPLEINLNRHTATAHNEGVISVCGNKCSGVLWGDVAVSKWFSDFLEVQCWLARFSNGTYELPSDKSGDKRDRSVAFANEQPLLLISKHAVQLLNDVLVSQNEKPVTSRHFRPNFVVSVVGARNKNLAHAEDGWQRLQIQNQNFSFDVVGQCARCSMVDVDPRSGAKGQTLRALADYRRSNGQINFGIFLKGSAENRSSDSILVCEGDVIACE